MATPVMEEMSPGGEMIGLWRTGRDSGGLDGARLITFEELGFPLSTRRVVFGKGPAVDVRLEGDVLISRQHFALLAIEEAIWIEDLRSRNGTRLNGVPLRQREQLEIGMRIGCGLTTLVAVDRTLKLRVVAGSYHSYLRNAAEAYGSARAAASKVGRHHTTFGRRTKKPT